MCKPRDGVGFARASRVLDQLVSTGPVTARRGEECRHGVPLMEAREHRYGLTGLLAIGVTDLLDVHERTKEVQPGVTRPHQFPQVRSAMSCGIHWVAGTAVRAGSARALIERQELGVFTGESSGHVDHVLVHCELDYG